eukprot:1160364-Pelagomonas_calceolata.AAC.4
MVEKRQRLLEAVRGRPQMDHPPSLQQGGQEQEQDLCEAEAEAAAVPSDLEAAIAFLRDEMRVTCPQLPPLAEECAARVQAGHRCGETEILASICKGLCCGCSSWPQVQGNRKCSVGRQRDLLRDFHLATGAGKQKV